MTLHNSENALLVFAKYPVPGEVKTRLSRSIGKDAAAAFYAQSIRYLLERLLRGKEIFDVIVAVGQESRVQDFEREFPGAPRYISQNQEADLGGRMRLAIKDRFEEGCHAVGIIGTDSPNLPMNTLTESYADLKKHDLVLSPAEDGGYYHLAVRDDHPELFSGISWSTNTVFDETIRIAESLGLKVKLNPVFYDIDDLADLKKLAVETPEIILKSGILEMNPELRGILNLKAPLTYTQCR